EDRHLRRPTGIRAVRLQARVAAARRPTGAQRELVGPEVALRRVELGRQLPLEAAEAGEAAARRGPADMRVRAARCGRPRRPVDPRDLAVVLRLVPTRPALARRAAHEAHASTSSVIATTPSPRTAAVRAPSPSAWPVNQRRRSTKCGARARNPIDRAR